MEPFRYHVYVCDQQKPDGAPCCSARGSALVIDTLRRELAAAGLVNEVQVTVCGSLGLCERGPNMVIYPEGIWYSALQPEDVREIVSSHFRQGQVVARLANPDAAALKTEISGTRDRALAALRAKDASGALPDDLNQAIRSFQESRVILTGIELDVFNALGEGATAAELAQRIQANPRATEMLLNALVSLGLLGKGDGMFSNTPVSKRYFTAGSKDDARAGLLHTANLWHRWTGLTGSVRTGQPAEQREVPDRGEDWTRAFIAAMHRGSLERAPLIVHTVGVEGVSRMLDVGGGSGGYSIAFARASEALQADILDLPGVLPITRGHIEEAGLASRIRTRAGDLRRNDLGAGYDLVLVSSICHMLNEAENKDLLARCFRALTPGGRLVIQEFILEADKTAPKQAALFSLNMLVGTQSGASYSEPEYAAWLAEAGFSEIRRMRLPGPTGLMVACRK